MPLYTIRFFFVQEVFLFFCYFDLEAHAYTCDLIVFSHGFFDLSMSCLRDLCFLS